MAKTTNEYQAQVDTYFYEVCPKSVITAIAVSLINKELFPVNPEITQEEHYKEVSRWLLKEWYNLYLNGIVPQRPPTALWQAVGEVAPQK